MKGRKHLEQELRALGREIETLKDEISVAQRTLLQKEKRQKQIVEKLASNEGNSIGVSDHAVLRYIERVFGFDLQDVRNQILTPDRVAAIKAGANQITANGVKFVIRNKTVVTVKD